MATIIFESADGERFTVPLQLTTYSTTIKTMLDNLEVDDTGSEVIPMPNIVSPILKKVLEWAKHEQEEPTNRGTKDSQSDDEIEEDDMTEWEKKFLEVENDTLYAITRAANYLDIQGLLDLTCLAIANKIKGKNSRQIREVFGLSWPTVENNKKSASTSISSPSV